MIALDTNVLVRFLTQDEPRQFAQAAALIAGLSAARPGYLCREVVIELVWVLERAYHLSRLEISGAIDGLLAARELVIEAEGRVGLAVERYRQGGAGFADRGYEAFDAWIAATRDAVASCRCEAGCPSCVQSPKCGNGNEPLDKAGAIAVLSLIDAQY